MRLRTRVDAVTTTLLAALGALPLGCGGSVTVDRAQGGAPGNGTGGYASGGVAVAGAPASNPFPCLNPSAARNGFQQCEDGSLRRLQQAVCPSLGLRPDPVPNYIPGQDYCQYDADCSDQPFGFCKTEGSYAGFPSFRRCAYGCISDSNCYLGAICACRDEPFGECLSATCTSGADCAPGFDCRSYESFSGCGEIFGFACQSPLDVCVNAADCDGNPNGWECMPVAENRICSGIRCEPGRPFFIHGEARVALACERNDWLDAEIEPLVDDMPPALRRRLAAEWARAGQMEHASIAAFARVALQLLSLGAPPSLIERATQAMADEAAHAKLCFALASRYGGHAVGPAKLSIDGSLDETTLAEIVKLTIREGCIGETVAAIEAAEAAEHATDPVVRAALRRISADETRHAELAWRFVKWAIAAFGREVRDLVKTEFARVTLDLPPAGSSDHGLLEHGILPEAVRHTLYAEVLTQVVEPCARAACSASHDEQPEKSANPALRLT